MFYEYRGFDFKDSSGPSGALLMGGLTGGIGGGDSTCTMPEHWLYQDTGMKKGDTIAGLVGWQWHGRPVRELPGLEVLAEGPIMPKNSKYHPHAATIYNGPQGKRCLQRGCDLVGARIDITAWAHSASSSICQIPRSGFSSAADDDKSSDAVCQLTLVNRGC